MSTVADLIAVLERHYPPDLAEEWDRIGLVCGDPDKEVRKVLFVVDVVDETVQEAREIGADLIIAHHPLLLRAVHTVATTTPKGRLLHQLIKADIALYVAHTNADAANPGVSDALAKRLDLTELRPLRPAPTEPLDKLVVFVPTAQTQSVLDAITAAGAASIGNYSRCAWFTEGTGTFLPGNDANPTIGRHGRIEEVAEHRLETIYPRARRETVITAMRAAHPYEELAFDVIELAPVASQYGIGRIGRLPTPMTLAQLVEHTYKALPITAAGVRGAGDPARLITTVAVSGGAGDSLLGTATQAGVDAFITADLRHHPVSEHLATNGPALIDAGHWATERPWLDTAARLLVEALPNDSVEVTVSDLVTDPWTCHATQGGANTA